MTSKELENISIKLSKATGLKVIFWYTVGYRYIEEKDIKEEDKTYYVVIKDNLEVSDSDIYFRTYSRNWEQLYEISKDILKALKYEIN